MPEYNKKIDFQAEDKPSHSLEILRYFLLKLDLDSPTLSNRTFSKLGTSALSIAESLSKEDTWILFPDSRCAEK